jgi:hypothetical protein
MMPTLSGQPSQSPHPAEPVLQYNEIVLDEAMKYTKLMQQLMDQQLDITKLCYMSGYEAFIEVKVLMVCVSPQALKTITAIARVDQIY